MKHIVTLTISNPAHEHISLRRRQSTTNYMVEARDEAEAIFRASNHFKKLGNYVHNAVIAESALNEEVEQIDELKKSTLSSYYDKRADQYGEKETDILDKGLSPSKENKALGKLEREHAKSKQGIGMERAASRMDAHTAGAKGLPKNPSNTPAVNAYHKKGEMYGKGLKALKAFEEVEQIDEISSDLARRYGGKAMRAYLDARSKGKGKLAAKRAKGANLASAKAFPNQYKNSPNKAKVPATNEEVEQIDELSKDTLRKYVKSAEADATNKNREATKNRLVGKRSPRHADAQATADALDRARNKRLDKMDLARAKMAKEEVEQIDELSKGTLASYITKASRQSSALHSLGKEFDNDKHMYAKKALNAKTPKTKEKAKADMETSGRLAKTFTRKAQNRTAGISRAAVKLAKEEVEQIDELSKKTLSSYVGKAYWDQGKRTSNASQVYGYVAGKYGRKATRGEIHDTLGAKEVRRDKTRDTGVERALSRLAKEEVQQIDEVGPQKRMTRLFNKLRDARAGDKFKRSGMPVPPPEPQHTNVAAHNKAIGRALRKEETVNEKAPPGAKYERMVKHIKAKYSADGKLTPKEKAIAYATAWKAKNSGK